MTNKEIEIQLALGTLTDNMKLKLARNQKVSKGILTKLSTDESWGIRCWVAFNPNTSKEVLTTLSVDEDWLVQRSSQQILIKRSV